MSYSYTDQLWIDIAKPAFPAWSEEELDQFRLVARNAYLNNPNRKVGKIYEQYLIMQQLSK